MSKRPSIDGCQDRELQEDFPTGGPARRSCRDMLVLSIGAGQDETTLEYEQTRKWGMAKWAGALLDVSTRTRAGAAGSQAFASRSSYEALSCECHLRTLTNRAKAFVVHCGGCLYLSLVVCAILGLWARTCRRYDRHGCGWPASSVLLRKACLGRPFSPPPPLVAAGDGVWQRQLDALPAVHCIRLGRRAGQLPAH